MTYDTWKTTEPPEDGHELPCKFETFSGVCLTCGADIGEECEVERERNRAMRRVAALRRSREVANVVRLKVRP